MADRRPEDQEMSRAKKPKLAENYDPASNPYLAHIYADDTYHNYGNGHSTTNLDYNSSPGTVFSNLKRHKTTALEAHEAEDGPNNPFNNIPLSNRYFGILKTRRDLPVHKQRRV